VWSGTSVLRHQAEKVATIVLILGLGAGLARAQDASNSESLGELARQLKAQRAKSHEKSKVYTNDDLEALPSLAEQSMAPPVTPSTTSEEAQPGAEVKPEEQAGNEKTGKEGDKESVKALPGQTAEEPHGEKYFRKQMGKLSDRLETDRRELDVLEQKLGQGQMMYYPNPNRGLYQESGPTAMSDVHTLQDQVAEKKKDIERDQEAIENLREQLRREGGDSGWLRSPDSPRASKPTSQVSEPVRGAPQSAKPEEEKETKEYWQARFKSVRAQLADAQERQHLAEDELNLLQIQDARVLNADVKAELARQIGAKQDEIAQKQALASEAQKALDDLRNEFEASGAPEEWSEEPEVEKQESEVKREGAGC
jgi:hypothetical protein